MCKAWLSAPQSVHCDRTFKDAYLKKKKPSKNYAHAFEDGKVAHFENHMCYVNKVCTNKLIMH